MSRAGRRLATSPRHHYPHLTLAAYGGTLFLECKPVIDVTGNDRKVPPSIR